MFVVTGCFYRLPPRGIAIAASLGKVVQYQGLQPLMVYKTPESNMSPGCLTRRRRKGRGLETLSAGRRYATHLCQLERSVPSHGSHCLLLMPAPPSQKWLGLHADPST